MQTPKQKKLPAILSILLGFLFISAIFLSSLTPAFAAPVAVGNTQTFIVSAYYSPLPNQQTYVWGSYEADKRMNGEGIRGADFTKVYNGMLAAPSSYPFGTKIYIPGFGTGTVHDRGGAINEWGNGDRIDIWMGWGDDGRKRALQWGLKTVTGTIQSNGTADKTNFSFLPASSQKNYGSTATTTEIDKTLAYESRGEAVTNLQEFLYKRGYLAVEPTGYFGKQTENAVYLFQKKYNIVSSLASAGAGVFGPKTRAKAEEIWEDPITTTEKIETITPTPTPPLKTTEEKPEPAEAIPVKTEQESTQPYNPDYAVIQPNLGKGDSNEAVKRLQIVLKGMGYFSGNITGSYDSSTENAVFAYQKANNIVSSQTQAGAGRFGPQTYSRLVNELLQKRKRIQSPISIETDSITKTQLAARRQRINLAEYNVEYGEKNDTVIALQNELIARGFLNEGLNTGFYGNQTQQAIHSYQASLS